MSFDLGADLVYAVRLLIAAALGALIGLEREIHDHPAGMRTHLLVSLGSAAFPAPGADPARIAAQVVTGVGFLGAGAILKEGATIRGLTTAASLWAVAAVGMAAGAGAMVVALSLTLIVIVSLWPLRVLAERFVSRDHHRVRMRLAADDAAALARVVAVVGEHDGTLVHLETTPGRSGGLMLDLEVRTRDVTTGAMIAAAVGETEGIRIEETSAPGD
jgi:putative Mg2+ transporter-C (MgtC) family protein